MTVSLITLIIDEYDGANNPLVRGSATLVPTTELTDSTNKQAISQNPVPVAFNVGGLAQVKLRATSDTTIAPFGHWAWTITFAGMTAPPAPKTFLLDIANGTTQYLSDLLPVSSGTVFAANLPLPGGAAPTAGQAPLALGDGTQNSAWGSVLPASQTVQSVAGQFSSLFQVQSTGGTDTVGPFGIASGALSINGILGHAYFFGYNALNLASGAAGPNGAMGASFFLDAGDTNVGGRHGIEANWGCFQTPDKTKATNALTVVAVDDNSNTVYTTLHHGAGAGSQIAFQDSPGTTQYAAMSATAVNGSPGTRFDQQIMIAGASGIFTVQATTSAGNAEMILNAGVSGVSELIFQSASVNGWIMSTIGTTEMLLIDSSSNLHMIILKGATAAAALTEFRSVLKVDSSLVVGTAALATAATDGFIYAPSCAGTPTGTPTAQAGTVPLLVDTTAGKLWARLGGTWKSVTFA